MARLPTATRESVPEDQRMVFDELVQAQARGEIPSQGPLAVMLHVPELMKRGEHVRAYVRGLIELTNLMGYDASLAFNMNAFEATPPADGPEPPLPV